MNSLKFSIQLATEEDECIWNNYLKKKKKNIPINYFSWSKIISSIFMFQKPLYLMVKDQEGNIRGLLCSFIVSSITGNKKLYSTRFGMVVDNEEVSKILFEYIENFCKKRKIDDFVITSGFTKYKSRLNCFEKISMTLQLNKNIEWLWDNLSSKTRNTIRRGYKNNFKFSSDVKYLRGFFKVYKKRMSNKNLPSLPLSYFKAILKKNTSNSKLLVALKDKEVIAGLILLYSKNGSQYTYAADDNSIFKNNMHCLLWEVIKFLYKKKIRFFDMTESKKNSGVYYFKKFFGCDEQKVYYYSNKKPVIYSSNKSLQRNENMPTKLISFFKKKLSIHFSRII